MFTVNPKLHVPLHPLPDVQDVLAIEGQCSVFSKIDLKIVFQYLDMDEVTRVLRIKYSIRIT